MTDTIHDNREAHRYELTVEGQTAVVIYNEVAGGLLIAETIVPPALEGRGIASRMAAHVMEDLKARGLVVLPTCPFFAAWLKKHPGHRDLVHPSYQIALGL